LKLRPITFGPPAIDAPMPASPASAPAAESKLKPIEIIMACKAGRISIGESRRLVVC
jgi:hypothetical protein